MKYNCKNYIRVFYEASEIWGRSKEKMMPSSSNLEISSEEKKRMEEFSEKLISAIVWSSDKKQALKTFSIWETALIEKFNGTLPKHWKSLIETVRGYITISPKLFERSTWKIITNKEAVATWTKEVKWAIKGDTKVISPNTERTMAIEPQSEVKVLPPSAEDANGNINTDTRKVLSEKERQESIDKFAYDLANQVLDNSENAEEIVEKKKQEILKYNWTPEYENYRAIIATVEHAINTKVFRHETWKWLAAVASLAHWASKLFLWRWWRFKEERDIFKTFFRNLVQDAWQRWEVQKVDELFRKRITHWLTDDEAKELLSELHPDKIQESYVDLMTKKDTDKEDLTSQQNIWKERTDKIIGKMSDPDVKEEYRKKYADTYANMTMLSELFDETSWFLWAVIWAITGKDKASLLGAARKMSTSLESGKDWSIWRATSWEFTFYTLQEMEDAVMKKWEKMEWMEDTAWENYLKYRVKDGDYKTIEKAFTWESLTALALYLDKLNYSSKIIDNNDWFKEYIKTKLPDKNADTYKIKTPEKWRTIEDLKNINKENYPTFIGILKDNQLDWIDKVTSDDSGYINILTIVGQIMDKNEGKVTPKIFQQLLDWLGKDNAKIREWANGVINSTTGQLEEKTIQDLLKSAGIPDSLSFLNKETGKSKTILFRWNIDCSTVSNIDELKILEEELEKKQNELQLNPWENKEKLNKIQLFLDIVKSRQVSIVADTAKTQAKNDGENPTDSYQAMSDPNARRLHEELSGDRAKQTVSSSNPDIPLNEKLLTDNKLPKDWKTSKDITIINLLEIQHRLLEWWLTSDDEKDLYAAIQDNIEERKITSKTVLKFEEFKREHGDVHAWLIKWYQDDNYIYSDENINSNLDYYRDTLSDIRDYDNKFRDAVRVDRESVMTLWGRSSDIETSIERYNTLGDLPVWQGSYSPSQIDTFSSLWLSPETLSTTNISQTEKWIYKIVTIDDNGRKYETNDVKEWELKNKMTDIDILVSMNAHILIPYMKMMQIYIPYNPKIRDISAKDEKEKKRIQLISAIALLLWEELPGTTGDREQDIQKLQQKYTTSSSVFEKLSSKSRWVNQIFDDGWSIIMSNFERILRWREPDIRNWTPEQIISYYWPQYIHERTWMRFDNNMVELKEWTISALNTLKYNMVTTDSAKAKAQWQVLTWEYHA
jgi:hypothetical protein